MGSTTVSPVIGALQAYELLQESVTFTSKSIGARLGAAQLVDPEGDLYATAYMHGIGVAPQIAYGPIAPEQLLNGLGGLLGTATDAAGDIFLVDSPNNRVLKIAPGGTQTTIGTGMAGPAGVAVDGAGNVYIGNTASTVVKVMPAGVQTTVASNLIFPNAFVVDGAGAIQGRRNNTSLHSGFRLGSTFCLCTASSCLASIARTNG